MSLRSEVRRLSGQVQKYEEMLEEFKDKLDNVLSSANTDNKQSQVSLYYFIPHTFLYESHK